MGGIVEKVINSYIYEKYEEVFTDFVDKFTEIRKKDGYYKIFGKLMINSLYGSMALKSEDDIFFYKVNASYIIIIKNDFKAKKYFKKKNNIELSNRNVSYASAIASKARIKLYRAMKNVINDGGRLLYCDTDSIFAAYNKTNNTKNFGNLEWLNFYDDAVFVSPKTYALKSENEEIKIKGISLKNISFYEFKNNFYNETSVIFKDQLNIKKLNFTLKQKYIEKKINLNAYDKRIFSEDKKTTFPLNIKHCDPVI
jgi:hypothetical protein